MVLGPSWQILHPVIWENFGFHPCILRKFWFTPLLIWANFGLAPCKTVYFVLSKFMKVQNQKPSNYKDENQTKNFTRWKTGNNLYYRGKTLSTLEFLILAYLGFDLVHTSFCNLFIYFSNNIYWVLQMIGAMDGILTYLKCHSFHTMLLHSICFLFLF